MEKTFFSPRILFIITLIFSGAIMRLVPHWPNFTPIAALALFGGVYINRKALAFLIPILAMVGSDLVLGFHAHMTAVYACFAFTVMIGFYLRKGVRPVNILFASLTSSTIFFLVTNFAEWLGSTFYPQSFAGLLACYAAGFPFYNSGILGDLFFNGVFFGGFYVALQYFPALRKVSRD